MSARSLDCAKQGRCPGCPLGAEPYASGLSKKGQLLRSALAEYGLSPEWAEPHGADPTTAYRLRAKLVTSGRALGLYERGSHRVFDIEGCPVLSTALSRTSAAVRKLLPLPAYGVDLRETSQGVLVTLLTDEVRAQTELEQAARMLVEGGDAFSVAVAVRRAGDVRLLASEPRVVAGPPEARHALRAGAPYAYAAHGGFVQAHAGQASHVHAEIQRGLRQRIPREAPQVLELFAGNGALALGLSQAGAHVTAVEAYAPAIALSERAAREQGLDLRAFAADAKSFVRSLESATFDAVIVNPPRRGLEPDLRESIAELSPRVLIYVSCNPDTLARDAWHFAALGLGLERVEPLDMIPWSDAVEALCWFSQTEPPSPRVLYEDATLLAVDKAPHEPVATADPLRNSLQTRVRRLSGCARAVPLEHWGPSVSGVCWFAKSDDVSRSSRVRREHELVVLTRGNVRKQGTISPEQGSVAGAGTRYRKQTDVGRHSLLTVFTSEQDEQRVLQDFARVRHPVLGDTRWGDRASNDFLSHRHGLDRAFVHVSRSDLDGVSASAPLSRDLVCVLARASD